MGWFGRPDHRIDERYMEKDLPIKIDSASTPRCTEACPNCCVEESTQRLAQIKSDDTLRNRALTFSMRVSIGTIAYFMAAAFTGKAVVLPLEVWNIIWVAIGAPWVGVGGGRVFEAISRKIEASKQP